MKSKIMPSVVVALVFIAAMFCLKFTQQAHAADGKVLYYTCSMHPSVKSDNPGSCPMCGMTLMPVYASADSTNNPSSSAANGMKPTPYPLKTCVVSGDKLGEMGAPIVFVYTNNGANQEIKFCCPMCKPKFLNDPDKYMKVIKEAEAKK
jgi:hypothetical protein